MDKHTPEPWEVRSPIDVESMKAIYSTDRGWLVFKILNSDRGRADAERIVACVNACREFSNEMLLDDGLVKLRNDRDELLAALQSAIADIEFAIEEGHPFGLDETLKILKAKGTNP